MNQEIVGKLFYDTVQGINFKDYTDDELKTWAPKKYV